MLQRNTSVAATGVEGDALARVSASAHAVTRPRCRNGMSETRPMRGCQIEPDDKRERLELLVKSNDNQPQIGRLATRMIF